MAKNKTPMYDDRSIVLLKGAERVRLRPAVIFGSDGLEGCEHSYFEILSNSVDEAREGYGDEIVTTVFLDGSIQIEDHGRGVPLGYNETGSLSTASCTPAENIPTTMTTPRMRTRSG